MVGRNMILVFKIIKFTQYTPHINTFTVELPIQTHVAYAISYPTIFLQY
jgi:hypothetical protein